MNTEKQTIQYNYNNYPFKSNCHFIIPFSSNSNIATKILITNGFEKYSLHDNVFSINESVKEILEKGAQLEVFEKNIDKMYYYNLDNEKYKNYLELRKAIPFYLKKIKIYKYDDLVNFADFEVIFDVKTNINEVVQTCHSLKYYKHYTDTFSTEDINVNGIIYKEKKPNEDSFLITALHSYVGNDIKIESNTAYVFNYTLCETEEEFCDKNLFYLCAGSSTSYNFSDEQSFKIYRQNDDVIQGIVREGVSRLIKKSEVDFYYDLNNPYGMINSYFNNYLLVYIIALRQFIGLKMLNLRILNCVKSNKKTRKNYKEFISLKKKGESFYLENVFVDVSHIMHINRTYNYIVDSLHIDKLIEDFYMDLKICDTVIEEQTVSSKIDKINKSAGWVLAASIISIALSVLQTIYSMIK